MKNENLNEDKLNIDFNAELNELPQKYNIKIFILFYLFK